MNTVPLKYCFGLSVFYGLGLLSMYIFTVSNGIHKTHFVKSITRNYSSRIASENSMKTYRFHLDINENISDKLINHIDATKVLELSQSLKNSGFTPARTVIFYNKPNGLNDNKELGPSLLFPKKFPKLYKPKKGIGFHDTCAILGNAGILLGSRCGKEIDAHDFVMRSNMAPTKGFEDDVGVKTSLTTLNFEKAKQIEKCLTKAKYNCSKYAKDLMETFNKTVIWFSKFGVVNSKSYFAFTKSVIDFKFGSEIAYPGFGMPKRVGNFWNISSASSGLVLYTIAGSICKKVSMYGFYPFYERPNGQPLLHHYYEKISYNYSGRHSMPEEYKMFLNLNKTGLVRLVTDQCIKD